MKARKQSSCTKEFFKLFFFIQYRNAYIFRNFGAMLNSLFVLSSSTWLLSVFGLLVMFVCTVILVCLALRDYFSDIEAVTATKSPQFRVQSLAVWADIIAPPMIPTSLQGEAGADVLAAQEQATASKFNEVKVRLAADAQVMNQYNLELNKTAGKQHVARVLHEKTQLATGKKHLVQRAVSHCEMFSLSLGFSHFCLAFSNSKFMGFGFAWS